MKKLLILIFIVVIGCTSSEEDAWQGKWEAQWTTDPAGYGDMAKDMKFEMNGSFEFNEDDLTVTANGYKGCVFGSDTLEHTLMWKLTGDTLELLNSAEEPGIQYKIIEQTDSKIRLQLLEDIFITLTK